MPSPSRKRTDWLQIGSGKSYWNRTHRPLQCLVFITPLLLFYQIGQAVMQPQVGSSEGAPNLVAFVLMLNFFQWFGAAGNYLPLLAVVAILLCWHLARRDPWDFEPKLYGGMAIESLVWGVPFVVIGMAVWRHFTAPALEGTTTAAGAVPLTWKAEVLLSVGAGVYEELLFRLVAINLLSLILMDLFEVKASTAIPIIVLGSAILFAAYHLLGVERFSPAVFAFRTTLGVYLAGIYVYRGFGIAVGAHTGYDLIIACLHAH